MSRVKLTATISLSIILLSFNSWGQQLEPVEQLAQKEQPQQQEQELTESVKEQEIDSQRQKPNFFQRIADFFIGDKGRKSESESPKDSLSSSGISIERHQAEMKDSLQASAMDSLVSSIITSSFDEKTDSITKARRDSIFFYELVNGIVNDEPLIDEVLEEACKHIGKRYVYGSPGPDTFDCSGFTSYCYRKVGIELDRTSKDQALNGFPVSRKQLRKGDIIIFGSRKNPRRIGHVGIVVEYYPETGRFKFIHAASSGVEFQWSDHSYYSIRYLGARRIID